MSSSDDNHPMDATATTVTTTVTTTTTTNPNAWIIDFMAGWCSGAVAIICCQPLDTLLTRYQAERSLTTRVSFTTIQKTSNWMQLWRGSIPMMSAVPFQNALLMAGYGIGKRWGEQHQQQGQPNGKDIPSSNYLLSSSKYIPIFIGGCTGGILQSFLMSPVEWIKIQRQVHWVAQTIPTTAATTATSSSSSSYHHLSVLFQHPTRGLGATMLRDGIPHGVWFVAYDWAKTNWTTHDDNHDTTTTNSNKKNKIYSEMIVPLGAGAFAATVAWAVGYPFDLIKTRIQANILSNSHKGIWETAIALYQESGGSHGLYRGFGLKLIRSIPASMIGFLVYEQVASLYG